MELVTEKLILTVIMKNTVLGFSMRLVKLNTRLLCALIIIALIAEAAGLAWLYLKYEDLGGRYRYTQLGV